MSGPSGMGKPAFMPASVRSQQAQQVQNVPVDAGDPENNVKYVMMFWQAPAAIPVSPAAVISKPATWQDDEDVFSTLLKYEKEVICLPMMVVTVGSVLSLNRVECFSKRSLCSGSSREEGKEAFREAEESDGPGWGLQHGEA